MYLFLIFCKLVVCFKPSFTIYSLGMAQLQISKIKKMFKTKEVYINDIGAKSIVRNHPLARIFF